MEFESWATGVILTYQKYMEAWLYISVLESTVTTLVNYLAEQRFGLNGPAQML